MSVAAKMRSECEQLNADLREIINAMPKNEQVEMYDYLKSGMTRSRVDRLNAIAYGLALCMFANVITNIAELREANA